MPAKIRDIGLLSEGTSISLNLPFPYVHPAPFSQPLHPPPFSQPLHPRPHWLSALQPHRIKYLSLGRAETGVRAHIKVSFPPHMKGWVCHISVCRMGQASMIISLVSYIRESAESTALFISFLTPPWASMSRENEKMRK